jgi:hypothetical protein
LRQENERYLSWLQGAPNTFPSLAHRIEELEGEKGDLLAKTSACVNNGKVSASVTPGGYIDVGEARRGRTFIDPKTGISIGVAKVGADYTADIVLGIPDAETPRQLKEVKPGAFWYAKVGTETYRVTVTDVNWLSDSIRAEVRDARSVSVSGPPERAPIE